MPLDPKLPLKIERKLELPHKVIKIDNCEYIETSHYCSGSYFDTITHKGNCNNPIHSHNRPRPRGYEP